LFESYQIKFRSLFIFVRAVISKQTYIYIVVHDLLDINDTFCHVSNFLTYFYFFILSLTKIFSWATNQSWFFVYIYSISYRYLCWSEISRAFLCYLFLSSTAIISFCEVALFKSRCWLLCLFHTVTCSQVIFFNLNFQLRCISLMVSSLVITYSTLRWWEWNSCFRSTTIYMAGAKVVIVIVPKWPADISEPIWNDRPSFQSFQSFQNFQNFQISCVMSK
jgi:hypothetical protein